MRMRFEIAAFIVLLVSACGGKSGAGSGSSAGSGSGGRTGELLSKVPQVTSPVKSMKLNLNGSNITAKGGSLKLDDNGSVKASNWINQSFFSGKSAVLCESAQQMITSLTQANEVDYNLCFIKAAAKRGSLPNFVENKWNYFKRDAYSNMRLKVKLETEGGIVKDFRMYSCDSTCDGCKSSLRLDLTSGNDVKGSVFSQPQNYLHNQDGVYSATTRKGRLEISGSIDADANWISKKIGSYYYVKADHGTPDAHGSDYSFERAEYSELSQFADLFALATRLIVNNISPSDSARNLSKDSKVFSKFAIINGARLQDLTFGEGAAKINLSASGSQTVSISNEMRTWDSSGIPRLPAAGQASYDDVNGTDLSALPSLNKSISEISSSGEGKADEVWNCEPEEGASFETFSLAGDNSEIGSECIFKYESYVPGANCEVGTYDNP